MQFKIEDHKQRFIYGCDLKVGDAVVAQGRPYLLAAEIALMRWTDTR